MMNMVHQFEYKFKTRIQFLDQLLHIDHFKCAFDTIRVLFLQVKSYLNKDIKNNTDMQGYNQWMKASEWR